jgi:hypothetical protein
MTRTQKHVHAADALTSEIVQLVTKHIPKPHGEADLDSVLLSVAMAYVSFASAFHVTRKAQKLLIELAFSLDDPDLRSAQTA